MDKKLALLWLLLGGLAGLFAAEKAAPELPKTGVNLAREGGGWINVAVENNGFVVSFFNDKKVQVAANVHHGLVRYNYVTKGSDRGALRRSGDGRTLLSPNNVEPPHVFHVYLALFNDEPDDLAETHAFFYRGK